MKFPRARNRGLHVAFGAALIATLLAIAGCGTSTASSTKSPTPSDENATEPDSSYTIEETPAGFRLSGSSIGLRTHLPATTRRRTVGEQPS